MPDNTTVTQLQSQNATSTQTTGNGRKKGGRNTKNSRKAANSAVSESQLQAETSLAWLEVPTTSQDPPCSQSAHVVFLKKCLTFPGNRLALPLHGLLNNDAFQITTPPQAAQVPMSTAPSSVPVDPPRNVESMFAPPKPTEVPLNNKRNAVKLPNYIDQCKNKLKVYVEDAMRSFAMG